MSKYRAVIEHSAPPSMEVIAGGSQAHCIRSLQNWVAEHGIPQHAEALIVEVSELQFNFTNHVEPDWSDMEQVRAEHARTGLNRTDEPPSGMAIGEMTSAQIRAHIYASKREQALAPSDTNWGDQAGVVL